MTAEAPSSSLRLRLGVFFILLWWLPIWLLAPAISDLLGYSNNSSASHDVFIALIIIQTVIGIFGLLLASREVMNLLKKLPRKKVPGAIWHIMISGKTDGLVSKPKET